MKKLYILIHISVFLCSLSLQAMKFNQVVPGPRAKSARTTRITVKPKIRFTEEQATKYLDQFLPKLQTPKILYISPQEIIYALNAAVISNNPGIIQYLFTNTKSRDLLTHTNAIPEAFILACAVGHAEIISFFLINTFSKPLILNSLSDGFNQLVAKEHTRLVDSFLKNPELRYSAQFSKALQLATHNLSIPMIKLLFKYLSHYCSQQTIHPALIILCKKGDNQAEQRIVTILLQRFTRNGYQTLREEIQTAIDHENLKLVPLLLNHEGTHDDEGCCCNSTKPNNNNIILNAEIKRARDENRTDDAIFLITLKAARTQASCCVLL